MKITKKAMTEYVKEKLKTNKKWKLKALIRIYQRQTEDEKLLQNVSIHNGIGFTRVDAFILTSFAIQYIKRKFLTSKQMEIVSNRIYKYHRQIIDMSDINKLNLAYINDPVNIQTKLELK